MSSLTCNSRKRTTLSPPSNEYTGSRSTAEWKAILDIVALPLPNDSQFLVSAQPTAVGGIFLLPIFIDFSVLLFICSAWGEWLFFSSVVCDSSARYCLQTSSGFPSAVCFHITRWRQ